MNAFKKIESGPILDKKVEIYKNDPSQFKNISTLFWPISEYGTNLLFDPPSDSDIIWPSAYFSSSALLVQDVDSSKHYLDFYEGFVVPVNTDPWPTQPTGDFTLSFFINEENDTLINYTFYFIPTQTRLFSVAWAHYAGSGGFDSSFNVPFTYPTKGIYNQIKMLFNDYGSDKFTLNDEEIDHFFVLSLDQKQFNGSLVPNTLVLPLMQVPELASPEGETQELTYTYTDYNQELKYSDNYGKYSYIVSGNLNSISSSEIFGAIYYDYNTVIINSQKLENTIFKSPYEPSFLHTGSVPASNTNFYLTGSQSSNSYMFGRLIRNTQYANPGPPLNIIGPDNQLSSTDFEFSLKNDIVDTVYFLPIDASEFNYTNNPTCFTETSLDIESGEYGKIFKFKSFKTEPVTYITTIGLYNDGGDLLAVAKLSKPLKKDFTTSYLFKIRVNY
jgi:hypothetical protein